MRSIRAACLAAHSAFRCSDTRKEIKDSTEGDQEGRKKIGQQRGSDVREDTCNRKLQKELWKGQKMASLTYSVIKAKIKGENVTS